MSDWKVSRQKIENIFPHPNADLLELCDIGGYQVVIKKGEFKPGDVVLFIPEKSILPNNIAEEFRNYLSGPNKDRVKSVKLRGEASMGIILPDDPSLGELDTDVSEKLGVIKYTPAIPQSLAGNVKVIEFDTTVHRHDVDQFRLRQREFSPDEDVVVTEKVHGSQIAIMINRLGELQVSSKGMIKKGLTIEESYENSYWQAVKNTNVDTLLKNSYPDMTIQAFGELIPVQKGFSYGQTEMTLRLFSILVNETYVNCYNIPIDLRELWVPILYIGRWDIERFEELKEGMECLSGRSLHIKEGIVIRPTVDRKGKKGDLMVKLLNSKYKETQDELD